jgi:hypothetical protein
MVVKEVAKRVIDALPDEASMDEIIHALYINTKFERGEKEVRKGRGVSHRTARKRLRKWVR